VQEVRFIQPSTFPETYAEPQTLDKALSQYSSQGVREHTAELATLALADNASLHSGSPTRRPFTADSTSRNSTYFSAPEYSSKPRRQDSVDSTNIPEVIEEVSEPVSPIAHASTGAAERDGEDIGLLSSSSALTNMIRRSKSDLRLENGNGRQSHEGADGYDERTTTIDQADGSVDEHTPLLLKPSRPAEEALKSTQSEDLEGQVRTKKQTKLRQLVKEAEEKAAGAWKIAKNPKSWDGKVIFQKAIKDPIGLLPCVFLGVLLNVLDALSYGKCRLKRRGRLEPTYDRNLTTFHRHDLIPSRRAHF